MYPLRQPQTPTKSAGGTQWPHHCGRQPRQHPALATPARKCTYASSPPVPGRGAPAGCGWGLLRLLRHRAAKFGRQRRHAAAAGRGIGCRRCVLLLRLLLPCAGTSIKQVRVRRRAAQASQAIPSLRCAALSASNETRVAHSISETLLPRLGMAATTPPAHRTCSLGARARPAPAGPRAGPPCPLLRRRLRAGLPWRLLPFRLRLLRGLRLCSRLAG